MKAWPFLPLLAVVTLAPLAIRPARAVPADPAAICGNLYYPLTRQVIAAARSYRWVLTSQDGPILHVELWTTDASGTRRYPGFICELNGNQPMTARPYAAPGSGNSGGNQQGGGNGNGGGH